VVEGPDPIRRDRKTHRHDPDARPLRVSRPRACDRGAGSRIAPRIEERRAGAGSHPGRARCAALRVRPSSARTHARAAVGGA